MIDIDVDVVQEDQNSWLPSYFQEVTISTSDMP